MRGHPESLSQFYYCEWKGKYPDTEVASKCYPHWTRSSFSSHGNQRARRSSRGGARGNCYVGVRIFLNSFGIATEGVSALLPIKSHLTHCPVLYQEVVREERKKKKKKISEVMAGAVVVFDFDKTIIDCDSDNWVIDDLGATDLFNELLPTMPWNTVMDTMMKELHSQGRTITEIEDSLKRAPLDPITISAIQSAHSLGCDLRIVSDANTFFIETVLKHHGLMGCFSEINTNPGYVDEASRLRISPRHDFTTRSHGCDLCPPNMCKSTVIERIKAEVGDKKIIYLGDGKGDFCPSSRLREVDYVMPRKDYPVWELICSNPSMIKAEVHEWSSWDEQERILRHLIETIIICNSNVVERPSALISSDCKLQLQIVPIPNSEAIAAGCLAAH